MNARMDNGLLLQGGLSTGSTKLDDCDVAPNEPNPGGGSSIDPDPFCSSKTPFLTQVKFLGSYTLPYDVQIAATYQSLPGQEIRTRMTFSSAEISAELGRPSILGVGGPTDDRRARPPHGILGTVESGRPAADEDLHSWPVASPGDV